MFSLVNSVIHELKSKRPVIIVDSEDRENEGDLVFPSEIIDANMINFMSTHCRGLICLCINEDQAQKLELSPITKHNYVDNETVANFTLPIEAATGVTTGISATDRAHTIRVAANTHSSSKDISIPGHIPPIIGNKKGLNARKGHTEASMSLIKMAGFNPCSVICEIAKEDGEMAKLDDLIVFSKKHNIKIVSINSIIEFMQKNHKDFSL